jgi:hypothetical protein
MPERHPEDEERHAVFPCTAGKYREKPISEAVQKLIPAAK